MYCENCGNKVKNKDNFCENCGHKLKKAKKPEIKKKTVAIIVITIALILGLISIFLTVRNACTPENVALDYFKAVTSNNVGKLYSYLNVPDKEFTSKKVFKNIMKETKEDKVINYSVTNSNVSTDNLEAEVTIKYITENGKSQSMQVNLVRNKNNKYLFFDNWEVNDEAELIKDYQIRVSKGSEVILAGEKLTKNYLEKEDSNSEYDVYKIPYMFKLTYPVTVSYPAGVTVKKEVKPVGFINRDTLDLSLEDLSKKEQKNISEKVLEKINLLYDSALDNKSYSEIKDNFSEDNEEDYNDFKELLNERFDAKNLKFSNVKLNRVSLDEDGNLNISFKIDYSYEKDGKEESSAYSKISFKDVKDYKITDFGNLKTYF